jgi:hypothetical protein
MLSAEIAWTVTAVSWAFSGLFVAVTRTSSITAFAGGQTAMAAMADMMAVLSLVGLNIIFLSREFWLREGYQHNPFNKISHSPRSRVYSG